MAVFRSLLAILALVAAASVSAADAQPNNKFIVTYSIFPDPLHLFSFYTMPRTIAEAEKDSFSKATEPTDEEPYSIWCRKDDYRVCVLFDLQGSVAGIQVSVAVDELIRSKNPLNLDKEPQWERKTVLGHEVYATTTYFVDPAVLRAGGRTLTDDTPTAEGMFIREGPNSVSRIPYKEDSVTDLGYTKQGCFRGMGRHYFYGARPEMKCEDTRPYFLLYGEKTHTLHGFGITQYGKTSQGRGWFETPPAFIQKFIVPTGPKCNIEWHKKYGVFTIHVYFIDKPWNLGC